MGISVCLLQFPATECQQFLSTGTGLHESDVTQCIYLGSSFDWARIVFPLSRKSEPASSHRETNHGHGSLLNYRCYRSHVLVSGQFQRLRTDSVMIQVARMAASLSINLYSDHPDAGLQKTRLFRRISLDK
jgi:hypothetical protein